MLLKIGGKIRPPKKIYRTMSSGTLEDPWPASDRPHIPIAACPNRRSTATWAASVLGHDPQRPNPRSLIVDSARMRALGVDRPQDTQRAMPTVLPTQRRKRVAGLIERCSFLAAWAPARHGPSRDPTKSPANQNRRRLPHARDPMRGLTSPYGA